jgi:hypothetical protein
MQLNQVLFTALTLVAGLSFAQIDESQVLFGVEYTFQDQVMVDEPGRNTISTPYKEKMALDFSNELALAIGLVPKDAVKIKTSWKQGFFLNVPGDGQWVINPEPVTIEVNTTPRHLNELKSTAKPIFEVAKKLGLKGYVQPAAERSGMGHIHVGAANMRENPFFANPQLLRNVMVYFHKNPALLHGFAEAFDIGLGSNIETYHTVDRQTKFQEAVAQFDQWFLKATAEEKKQGLTEFLKILAAHDSHTINFFHHYRFINLEHLERATYAPFQPEDKGKLTVEFRNFRPPADPETTHAFAKLLMSVMKYQSQAGHLEPFKWISESEYLRFNTASRVKENWVQVKKDLNLKSRALDRQIQEYASAIQRFQYPQKVIGEKIHRSMKVNLAYSQKTRKGQLFEILIEQNEYPAKPRYQIGEHVLDFSEVVVGSKKYWLTVVDVKQLGIHPSDIVEGKLYQMMTQKFFDRMFSKLSCKKAVSQ